MDVTLPFKKGDQPPPTQMEDAGRRSRVFGPGPDRKEGMRYTLGKKRVRWHETQSNETRSCIRLLVVFDW
jgi:hypothetical protein